MKSVFEVWRNFRAFWHACPRYFFVWLHQSLFEKRKTKKCSTPCYLFSFFLSFFLPFLPYFILSCVFIFIFIYFFWLRWFSFVFGSFLFCVPFPPDVNQWNTRGITPPDSASSAVFRIQRLFFDEREAFLFCSRQCKSRRGVGNHSGIVWLQWRGPMDGKWVKPMKYPSLVWFDQLRCRAGRIKIPG